MRSKSWPMQFVAVALVIALMLGSGTVLAQSYDPDQDIPKPTKLQIRMEKLGRGLTNVLFGWTEIPITWHNKIQLGKPLTYIVVTGTVLGVTRGAIRTGVGVYETFTFYSDNRDGTYNAIIEPEYLF